MQRKWTSAKKRKRWFHQWQKTLENGCNRTSLCRVTTREIIREQHISGREKGWGNRPIINLKKLNQFTPYYHFNMECLQSIKDILKQVNFKCKLDLRDAYCYIPLSEDAKKYVKFYWEGNLYQFLGLCFGLSLSPYIFTKLLKVPITFLHRLGKMIISYLDDMIILGISVNKTLNFRNTVILLLQELGFVINREKSVMIPKQVIECLGMEIDPKWPLTISLPQEKVQNIKLKCRNLHQSHHVSILELTMSWVIWLP